jgi:phosphoribosylcarboxyaminoimidazole (NCAIR) mutase
MATNKERAEAKESLEPLLKMLKGKNVAQVLFDSVTNLAAEDDVLANLAASKLLILSNEDRNELLKDLMEPEKEQVSKKASTAAKGMLLYA